MAITHTDLDDPLTKNMNFKYGQKQLCPTYKNESSRCI